MLSYHQKFPHKNQTKSFIEFLVKHILRATHFPRYTILPQFAKILYFSSLSVKFQPSECIISINFDHFASSFNFVRGVIRVSGFELSTYVCDKVNCNINVICKFATAVLFAVKKNGRIGL